MKAKLPLFFQIGTLVVALAITVGCTKAPNDAQVTSDIQSKIGTDSELQNKALTVQTEKGTVTLSGGTGSVTNACITATGVPHCVDTTAANGISCTPGSGSMSFTNGVGSDVVSWIMLSSS